VLASAALLALGAIATGCTANVNPPRGASATTTTTDVDPYAGTAQRRTITTY
jgi:hypothetical protein